MKVLRLPFKRGRLIWEPGEALIRADEIFASSLTLVHSRHGDVIDERDLGSGLVTTAGVVYLAADFAGGASDISAFTYHATGIGTTAAAVGNTAMENTTGCPARVSGTASTPGSTNIWQSQATVTFGGSLAITEWGLFSASSGGTLWDRRVFAAVNVLNNDTIQFTYQLTCAAGG